VLTAFWAGALAGLGIAVPVGAIAILLIDLGTRRGFLPAFAAGSGAASADLLYASLAAFAGAPVAALLAPMGHELRVASGLVLVAIALLGLRQAVRGPSAGDAAPARRTPPAVSVPRTYLAFLGLTLLNPMTVTYFAALVLGGAGGGRLAGPAARAAFVAGAAVASWSWQTLLAGSGALLHARITPLQRRLTGLGGNLIVLTLAARILATA
jgi:arginine exporter protein ArgO